MQTLELILLGLAVGTLAGVFGIGGGFIMTPLLSALVGLPPSTAIGSSLCALIGTTAGGVARYMRLALLDVPVLIVVGGGVIAGTELGVRAHDRLRLFAMRDGGTADSFQLMLNGFYVAFLALVILLLLHRPWGTGPADPGAGDLSLRGRVMRGVRLSLLGLFIGVVGGLLGIGGGALAMPLLASYGGLALRRAVGTSLGIVLIAYIAGTWKFGLRGDVDVGVAAILLVGSSVGVQGGIRIGQLLPAVAVRRGFLVMLCGIIVLLILRSYRIWGAG